MNIEIMLRWMRQAGWRVAVHNDYEQNGQTHTFWLLTNPGKTYVKGEGLTDQEALQQCWDQIVQMRRSAT